VSFTKLDYCQYLLSSQTNYTLTNLAEHLQVFSHDTINRYLRGEKLTPRLLWDNVEHHIQVDEDGSIILMILLLIKTPQIVSNWFADNIVAQSIV